MTAYSFKKRFVEPIRWGLGLGLDLSDEAAAIGTPKRQTIRADRKRHARPGEELQLYCGMRTKGCFLIGRARCTDVARIHIHFRERRQSDWIQSAVTGKIDRPYDLSQFAKSDGFESWGHMREFWSREHPGIRDFSGIIIKWEPLP